MKLKKEAKPRMMNPISLKISNKSTLLLDSNLFNQSIHHSGLSQLTFKSFHVTFTLLWSKQEQSKGTNRFVFSFLSRYGCWMVELQIHKHMQSYNPGERCQTCRHLNDCYLQSTHILVSPSSYLPLYYHTEKFLLLH